MRNKFLLIGFLLIFSVIQKPSLAYEIYQPSKPGSTIEWRLDLKSQKDYQHYLDEKKKSRQEEQTQILLRLKKEKQNHKLKKNTPTRHVLDKHQ